MRIAYLAIIISRGQHYHVTTERHSWSGSWRIPFEKNVGSREYSHCRNTNPSFGLFVDSLYTGPVRDGVYLRSPALSSSAVQWTFGTVQVWLR